MQVELWTSTRSHTHKRTQLGPSEMVTRLLVILSWYGAARSARVTYDKHVVGDNHGAESSRVESSRVESVNAKTHTDKQQIL